MQISELELPEGAAELFSKHGIDELYPPQAEAAPLAVAGKNLVLSIPTASGKSLVAYLAVLSQISKGGKAIYIVPLRALAQEKYSDLSSLSELGFRVSVSTGDLDSVDRRLEKSDVIVCTSEKADSLLRHGTRWMGDLGVIVVDEVHLINDHSRGPTIEVLLTRLRRLNPRAQIIALSATIRNSSEIADWLGAEHIHSEWRPVELREGVLLDGTITFTNNQRREVEPQRDMLLSLVKDTVSEGGQCLVFVNTRKSAQSVAGRVSKMLGKALRANEVEEAEGLSKELSSEEETTGIGTRLQECISKGAAFHHAGLSSSQRSKVESGFKDGTIKCIVATPTLAAGINLPARRVVVRDLRRFDVKKGSVPLPVLEVKQMCGRAGRPGLDPYGEAVLLAKSQEEKDFLFNNYLLGEPEEIESRLASEAALRFHLLALIATDAVRTEKELTAFMDETFLSYRGRIWALEERVEEMLGFLNRQELITIGSRLEATHFGKRCSDLYLDPLSAVKLRDALARSREGLRPMAYLHAICSTPDMPTLYLRKNDYAWASEALEELEGELLLDVPDGGVEYEFYLSALKTAALLQDWIGEKPESQITDVFGIGPGDVHREVDMSQWLIYSMSEISRLLHIGQWKEMMDLERRLRYGVRPELLDLVALKGVGRRRARLLYNAGFKRRDELVDVRPEQLMRLTGIGKKVAESIINQVESLVRGV